MGDQVTPIIDLMAISNAHFAKLRDFITLRLPPGFPVKIGEKATKGQPGLEHDALLSQVWGYCRGQAAQTCLLSSQRFPSSTCSMPESPSVTCVAVMSL